MAANNQWKQYTTDQNLAIALAISLVLGYLPFGILDVLSPIIVLVVAIALFIR